MKFSYISFLSYLLNSDVLRFKITFGENLKMQLGFSFIAGIYIFGLFSQRAMTVMKHCKGFRIKDLFKKLNIRSQFF